MNYKNKKRGNKTSMSSYNNNNVNKSMSIQKHKTNYIEDNIRNHSIGSYLNKKFFFNKNRIKKS